MPDPLKVSAAFDFGIQVDKRSFFCTVAPQSAHLPGRTREDHRGAWSRTTAPLHGEESAKVTRASVSEAFWTPCYSGVLGMSRQEEAPGKT